MSVYIGAGGAHGRHTVHTVFPLGWIHNGAVTANMIVVQEEVAGFVVFVPHAIRY